MRGSFVEDVLLQLGKKAAYIKCTKIALIIWAFTRPNLGEGVPKP